MTRSTIAPQKRPSRPACSVCASEQGDAQRVHAVAEQCEDGGKQRQRRDHGDDPDEDRAGGEAAEDGARNEQEPEHREHEGDPAEEDGTAGGGARGCDRILLFPPLQPLLPVPRKCEQRVVDSESEAHADQHVLGEDGKVVRLRQECHERERDDDRRERKRRGTRPATTAPKTSSSTTSAIGAPKKSSPFFRSSSDAASSSASAVRSPVTAAS